MRYFLAATLCCSASFAQAACPTGADLATGIKGTLEDGATDTYTRFSDHVVQSIFEEPDGSQFRALSGKGVYLIETVDIIDGSLDPESRSIFAYPQSPADLPEPAAGTVFNAKVTARILNGGPELETHSYSFGQEVQATYGNCTFRMIKVQNAMSGPDEAVETLHFFPDLGFAYLAAYASTEDGTWQEDVYTYVSFESVAQ